jgi:hypothetical protein
MDGGVITWYSKVGADEEIFLAFAPVAEVEVYMPVGGKLFPNSAYLNSIFLITATILFLLFKRTFCKHFNFL